MPTKFQSDDVTLKWLKEKIEPDEKLKLWLQSVNKTETNNTKNIYTTAMKYYCKLIGKTPTELIELALKEQNIPLTNQGTFIYISNFKESIKLLANTTRVTYIAAISSFYLFHDIPVSKKLLKFEGKPTKKDDNKLLIDDKIVSLAFKQSDDLLKLIIAIQFVSGLSMNDALNIKVKKLKENIKDDIACLNLKRQKTKVDFHTFLSPVATKFALNWCAKMQLEQDDFLICEKKGERLDEKHCMYLFRKASKNMIVPSKEKEGEFVKGLPHEKYDFNQFHSHNLRKLFFNALLNIGGFEMGTLAEYFMGHAIPNVRASYFQANPDKLRDEYKKFIGYFDMVLDV